MTVTTFDRLKITPILMSFLLLFTLIPHYTSGQSPVPGFGGETITEYNLNHTFEQIPSEVYSGGITIPIDQFVTNITLSIDVNLLTSEAFNSSVHFFHLILKAQNEDIVLEEYVLTTRTANFSVPVPEGSFDWQLEVNMTARGENDSNTTLTGDRFSIVVGVTSYYPPPLTMQCSPAIPIEVHSSSSPRTGTTYCTATNPTQYVEDVTITVTADGLAVAHPGLITVGAYDSTTFEVVVRGESGMLAGNRSVIIVARIISAGGIPIYEPAPISQNVTVVIQQYSRLRAISELDYFPMLPGHVLQTTLKIYNDGNAEDVFAVEVLGQDEWEKYGFRFDGLGNITLESFAPPENLQLNITMPDIEAFREMCVEVSILWSEQRPRPEGAKPICEGMNDIWYMDLRIHATSNYSIRTEGVPNYQSIMLTLAVSSYHCSSEQVQETVDTDGDGICDRDDNFPKTTAFQSYTEPKFIGLIAIIFVLLSLVLVRRKWGERPPGKELDGY